MVISITDGQAIVEYQKEMNEIHKLLSPELQERMLAAYNKFWEAVRFTETESVAKLMAV